MTQTPQNSTPKRDSQTKMIVEFGPLIVFVIVYQWLRRSDPDGAMLTAAGVFLVLAVIALIYARVKTGKFSGVLLFSTAIIVVTAGLAIFSGNKTIFYMKPTILNGLFGIGAIGGALMGKNPIKLMMGEAAKLSDAHWKVLAFRWGIYFLAIAALNEFIWRNFSENFWVNFKLFGMIPLTFVFAISQVPYMMRNGTMAGMEETPESGAP